MTRRPLPAHDGHLAYQAQQRFDLALPGTHRTVGIDEPQPVILERQNKGWYRKRLLAKCPY